MSKVILALFGLMFFVGCGTDVTVSSGTDVCTGTECGESHNDSVTTTDTTD